MKLLKAYPHRWGEGKVHIAFDDRWTSCGIEIHAEEIEGEISDITCKWCLKKLG